MGICNANLLHILEFFDSARVQKVKAAEKDRQRLA
jgi:hypothetical protein